MFVYYFCNIYSIPRQCVLPTIQKGYQIHKARIYLSKCQIAFLYYK